MFEERKISVTFLDNGRPVKETPAQSRNGVLRESLSENTYRLTVLNQLPLQSAQMEIPLFAEKEERIFMNGFQSWTDSRERCPDEKMRGLNGIPRFLQKKYAFESYGDYRICSYPYKKGISHGFSYCYFRKRKQYRLFASLNEKTGYTVFHYDNNRQVLRVEKDLLGVLEGTDYEALSIFYAEGTEDEVFEGWFERLQIPKPAAKPIAGYTSWYNHYQNICESVLEKDLDGMESLPVKADIFQIDDGYQTAVGDWLCIDSEKFPGGMKKAAERIHEKGYLAGLWLAPFAAEKTSRLFAEHPDWFLQSNGKPLKAGANWSGFYALDSENAEVRRYISKVLHTVLKDWGYDLVKLDFLYAAGLIPRNGKSRGQLMCEAMEFLRKECGSKLILGCGVPLMPAFGLVDYCRIGCDVGLDWDDKLYMRIIHRERVSTKNAIGNTVFRRQLNGRAFLCDPDVFLLRNDNIRLSGEQKRMLAFFNGLFGSVLFTSDNAAAYSEQQRAMYKEILALQNAGDITVHPSASGEIVITYRLNGKFHTLLL